MTEGDLVELAKRRGFFHQTAEPYGGVGGFFTFGPQGAALKRNVEDAWRDRFTIAEGNLEIEAPTVLPEPVFEASSHLETFNDLLVECPSCGQSHRADHLVEDNSEITDAESRPIAEVESLIADLELACPACGTALGGEPVTEFNLMFKTNIGPGDSQPGYLRPETAQGIFVDFPRLKEYARESLPFGVTQIGPAYRNEISPRKQLVRVRELTQAELELFLDPEEDEPPIERVADVELPLLSASAQADGATEPGSFTVREAVDEDVVKPWIAYYLGVGRRWYEAIGIDMGRFRYRQHLPGELSHYSSDCWDAEGDVGTPDEPDWIELAGFAYRGNYDLSKHDAHSDADFSVFKQYDEPLHTERATVDPDMSYLGPEFGARAGEVVDALEELAATDPDAFDTDGEPITVELDGGETVSVPAERVGFAIETETVHGEHFIPHVMEPSCGIDRAVYTLLVHALREDEVAGETRRYLALPPEIAPTFVGVFPLREDVAGRATDLADRLRARGLSVAYDDSGSIGRRYRRQDEVGTPFCVTLDEQTPDDGSATIRERDSTDQVRVPLAELPEMLTQLRAGELDFADIRDQDADRPGQVDA